jgi:hypothetical protein
MLTFEGKLAVIESFPQLERKNVSLGRVNFHYEESAFDKKAVVYHLHPNGNGYVYAGHIPNVDTDDKGMVNIRDYSADDLRDLIQASIDHLSQETGEIGAEDPLDRTNEEQRGEYWVGPDNHKLLLVCEDELWNIYTSSNLEAAFESYTEAEQYLLEEGFQHHKSNK